MWISLLLLAAPILIGLFAGLLSDRPPGIIAEWIKKGKNYRVALWLVLLVSGIGATAMLDVFNLTDVLTGEAGEEAKEKQMLIDELQLNYGVEEGKKKILEQRIKAIHGEEEEAWKDNLFGFLAGLFGGVYVFSSVASYRAEGNIADELKSSREAELQANKLAEKQILKAKMLHLLAQAIDGVVYHKIRRIESVLKEELTISSPEDVVDVFDRIAANGQQLGVFVIKVFDFFKEYLLAFDFGAEFSDKMRVGFYLPDDDGKYLRLAASWDGKGPECIHTPNDGQNLHWFDLQQVNEAACSGVVLAFRSGKTYVIKNCSEDKSGVFKWLTDSQRDRIGTLIMVPLKTSSGIVKGVLTIDSPMKDVLEDNVPLRESLGMVGNAICVRLELESLIGKLLCKLTQD